VVERPLDLRAIKVYWLLIAHHFDGLLIDLSLFDFRGGENPEVRQDIKLVVPVERAYDEVLGLLDEYHRGKDILWRPSFYYKNHLSSATTTLIWVDNFQFKNPYKIKPPFFVYTEQNKFQAYFKLKHPVSIEEADKLQKELAKHVGDGTPVSFFQHRQIAGLSNAKFFFSWKMFYLTPQQIYSLKSGREEDEKESTPPTH